MIFDVFLFFGLIIMYFTFAKSVKYKEGSIEYLTLQDFFNFGFWLSLTGIIVKWLLIKG